MAMAGRVHLLAGLLLLGHADAQMGGQYGGQYSGGGGAGGAGGTSDMKGMLCGILPIPLICTQGGQGGPGAVQCQNNACCQQSSCYMLSMAGCMPSRGATTCEGTTLMNPLQAGKCVCLNGYVCGQTGQCQQPGIGGVLGNIANGIAGGILGGGGGGNQPAVSGGSGGGGINWGQYTPPPNWGQYTPPPNGWGQHTPPPNWGQYTPPPSQNGGGGNWWDPNQWGNFLNQFTGGGGGNQQPNPPPSYPNYPNFNGNHFGRLYEVSKAGEQLPPGGVIREDHTLVLSMYLTAFIGALAFLTLHAVRYVRRLRDRNDGTVREMLVSQEQESCEEGQLTE